MPGKLTGKTARVKRILAQSRRRASLRGPQRAWGKEPVLLDHADQVLTPGGLLQVLTDRGETAEAPSRSQRVERRALHRRATAALRGADPSRLGATTGGASYLETRAVTDRTREEYVTRLKCFSEFAEQHGMSLSPVEKLDEALADRADYLYFEGFNAGTGGKLLGAMLNAAPELQGKLPRFARALKAWRRLAPGRTRVGLPWPAAVLVSALLACWGLPLHAAYVLLTFSLYLRPSEALSLLVRDLLQPTPNVPSWAVRLHPEERGAPSKTGSFDDGLPLDSPYLNWLGPVLLTLTFPFGRNSKMFAFDYQEIKEVFGAAMHSLQLGDPSLYRLRHGGASHDRAANFRTIGDVKRRGRWVADASVRRYEKPTILHAEEGRLPNRLARLAVPLERLLSSIISGLSATNLTSARTLFAQAGVDASSKSLQAVRDSQGHSELKVSQPRRSTPTSATTATSSAKRFKRSSAPASSVAASAASGSRCLVAPSPAPGGTTAAGPVRSATMANSSSASPGSQTRTLSAYPSRTASSRQ